MAASAADRPEFGFHPDGVTVAQVLVRAPVQAVAGSVRRATGCKAWRKNCCGKGARALGQSFIVFRMAREQWTAVQSASGDDVTFDLARTVSRQLKCRAIWIALSDPASTTLSYLFDRGAAKEVLESFSDHDGTADHLPAEMIKGLKIQSTGRGIFGSALRKVALSKLKTPGGVDRFIDAVFRKEKIRAPICGEWDRRPGMRKLDLPDVDAEEVERLDFLSGGKLKPRQAGPVELPPEAIRQALRARAEGDPTFHLGMLSEHEHEMLVRVLGPRAAEDLARQYPRKN